MRASVLLSSTEILNLLYDMLKYYFKTQKYNFVFSCQIEIDRIVRKGIFFLSHLAFVIISSKDCRSKKKMRWRQCHRIKHDTTWHIHVGPLKINYHTGSKWRNEKRFSIGDCIKSNYVWKYRISIKISTGG